MTKARGFEVVKDKHRIHKVTTPTAVFDNKIDIDGAKYYVGEITLPARADERSAGYDFFLPVDVTILPAQKTLVFLDVKAYMQSDEILEVYPRSSLGVKQGIMLSNTVGIIDSSYYNNPNNDGNIGLALLNTSGVAVKLKRGERVAQGIFKKFLVADNDTTLGTERAGGFGSSGK